MRTQVGGARQVAGEDRATTTVRPTMAELAKDLDVGLLDLYKLAQELKFNLTRGAAKVTPKQEARLREQVARGGIRHRHHPEIVYAQPRTAVNPPERLAPLLTFRDQCTCCKDWFTYEAERQATRLSCDTCEPHFPLKGEDANRELARLRDHDARLRGAVERAWESSAAAAREADRAFRSRHSWMRTLVLAMC